MHNIYQSFRTNRLFLYLLCLCFAPIYAIAGNLYPGQRLASGATFASGNYSLFMNPNGNLEFINNNTNNIIWTSTTENYANRGASVVMQGDGNLVIYRPSGEPIWASGTDGHSNARLAVQGDGNLVIYNAQNAALWSSKSTPWGGIVAPNQVLLPDEQVKSEYGAINLYLQAAGTLVLRNSYTGEMIWHAPNNGVPATWAIMQDDGNLVVFGANNRVIWESRTWGNHGAFLHLLDDGNMAIASANSGVLWKTNTEVVGVPQNPNQFLVKATVDDATASGIKFYGFGVGYTTKIYTIFYEVNQRIRFYAEKGYSYRIQSYSKYRDYAYASRYRLQERGGGDVSGKHNELVDVDGSFVGRRLFDFYYYGAPPTPEEAVEECPYIWDYAVIEATRQE